MRRFLARADALMNGLYGWRYNPLYHSGALVVALLAVILVTGIYLTTTQRQDLLDHYRRSSRRSWRVCSRRLSRN